MNDEIDNVLQDLRGIVLVLHDSMEFTQCLDFYNKIKSNHFTNILYISLTRSYDYMRHALEQKPFNQKRILFIDCVSGFAFPAEENIDVCFYHKPPRDIHSMEDIIRFGIEKTNPDIIIIDSLTQFINFSRPTEQEVNEFYSFLQDIRKQMLNLVNNTFILLFDTRMGVIHHLPTKDIDIILKMEANTSSINDRIKRNMINQTIPISPISI